MKRLAGLVALGVLAAGTLAAGNAAAATAAELFVAPTGSGTACTVSAPCGLVEARDKVRTLNAAMAGDIVVTLQGGVYRLSAPLQLTAQDSGTGGHKVIWRSAPGATAVLSGGQAVTGWQLADAARNIYRAPVPPGTRSRQLYVDGVRAVRARSAMFPTGFTKSATGFTTADPAYRSWANQSDVEIVSRYHWKHMRCPLASITASGAGSSLNAANPCWDNIGTPNNPDYYFPYNGSGRVGIEKVAWLENAYPLLDSAGEWYLDRSAGQVYYIPRQGENLATSSVELAVADGLVDIAGTPGHVEVVNGGDSRAAYTGTWGTAANRPYGDVADDVRYTQTNGDSVTFSFTGTGLDVLGERFGDLGDMDVYVDGVFDRTVSAYGSGARLAQQVLYSRTGLAKGPHTVRMVKKSGQYMVIDAFAVVPEVIAPVHDIALRGLTFSHATWSQPSGPEGYADNQAGVVWVGTPQRIARTPGAVRVVRGQRIEIADSEFSHLGGAAIDLAHGTQDSTVIRNRVFDISGAGVSVGEFDDHWLADPARQTARNTVADNHITKVGAEFEDAVGILVGNSREVALDHNEIAETPYSGISLGWGWGWASPYNTSNQRHGTIYSGGNKVTANYVHDVMKVLSDGGHLYTLGGQGDGSVRSVAAANVFSKGGSDDPRSQGLYHDEGSSWWNSYDNVVSQTGQNWTMEWIKTIHDITIQDNFSDVTKQTNNGTDVTITGTTFVQDGVWPQRAKDVVAAAGPRGLAAARRAHLVNDGELGGLLSPAAIAYTGTWGVSRERSYGDLNGDIHYTQTNGDAVTVTFTGTGVRLLGERASDQGQFAVTLDGAAAGSVDTYSPTRVTEATVYQVSNLPYGSHTVRLTKTSGSTATFDGALVDHSIDDGDPSVRYTGAWFAHGNRGFGDFENDIHATTANGDAVTVPFTGTGIDVSTETNSDQGQVDVYVDGRFQRTIDTYSPTRAAAQRVFTVDGLVDAVHSLRLVKRSGQYMVVDRFTIR